MIEGCRIFWPRYPTTDIKSGACRVRSLEVEINIKPERMAFLKFIIEGFGHLALPVTLSAKEGKIKLLLSPHEKDRWEAIQKDLQGLF